jgi:hypothetical protein
MERAGLTVSVNGSASCSEFVVSSAWATRLSVPVKPVAGVNVTSSVFAVDPAA